MSMVKLSMLFDHNLGDGRSSGWSESFYFSDDITGTNWAGALDLVSRARADLLPSKANIIGARVTAINDAAYSAGEPQRGYTVSNLYPGGWQGGPHGADNQDMPQVSLIIRGIASGAKNMRTFEIRGMPDDIISQGVYAPSRPYQTRMSAYLRAIAANNMRFRGVDYTKPVGKLVSVDANGNFVFAPTAPLQVNWFIELLRVRDINNKSVRGVYQIGTVAADGAGKFIGWPGNVVNSSGKVRIRSFTYPLFAADSLQAIRTTVRKVGRPFGLWRGRASARK